MRRVRLHRPRGAGLLVTLQVVAAAVALFGSIIVRGRGYRATWLEQFFNLINIPVTYSVVSALVVGVIAIALLRRKRIGWWAAVGQQVLGILV